MAVLGVQLVVTMLMISVLHKFSLHFSLARWILSHRLVRFLHPSDDELRSLAGVPKNPNKGKGKKGKDRRSDSPEKDDEFLVPRNLHVQLDSATVNSVDMMQLRFYPEYQWLLDFAACAIMVYSITELYFFLMPRNGEVNLSIVWCLLVIGFTVKILFSLTAMYFKGDEAIGERSLCLTSGFLFFVLAMVVLIVDENFLEFGLQSAYSSFNVSAHHFLAYQGVNSSGPTSQLMFKFWLAVWCGLVGAFFTFPGLRFARMHRDALTYSMENPFMRMMLHLSFISPLFVVCLWIKPIARDYFTIRTWPGISGVLMQPPVFETTRLVVVIVVVLLRFILMPKYLQSYLNMAPKKLDELKKEAGRISNVELQRMVARVFYYLCVVALQYVTPLLLCLFTTFLLKTLGDYKWSTYIWNVETNSTIADAPLQSPRFAGETTLLETSRQFSLALANLKDVFTPVLYRGVLGFMTWWLCAAWFGTSAIGLMYHSYFSTT